MSLTRSTHVSDWILLWSTIATISPRPELAAEPWEGRIVNVPGVTGAGPWRVQVSTAELPATAGAAQVAIDISSQKGALRIRPRQPGDRIRYHGIERKLADLLSNEKVPAWERLGAVVIADSARVLACLTSHRAFEADRQGGQVLYVRLTPAQPLPPPKLEIPGQES